MERQTLDNCTACEVSETAHVRRRSRAFLPCTAACSSERCNVTATERILFIYRYIYVIYIKYIYIFTYIGTRKSMETSINGTMLLEKCFNFHIPIR